jgi:hypothetical protein
MSPKTSTFDDYSLPLAVLFFVLGFGLPYLWTITAIIFVLIAAQTIAG